MMITSLSSALRRLARCDEGGAQTISLILVFPALVWATCALYAFTDAFRVRAMLVDANSVVADTLSRETKPINLADLQGLKAITAILTREGSTASIRVTQVACVALCSDPARRELAVIFSKGIGLRELVDGDLLGGKFREHVPVMARGDRVILTHVSFEYEPPFGYGIPSGTLESVQATRMRFAPRLCWETCDLPGVPLI